MKTILTGFLFLAFSTAAFADNKARIEELGKEGQQLVTNRARMLEQVKQIEARIMEINGAIKELNLLDAPKKDPKKGGSK